MSYWYQIQAVRRFQPQTVLEIGLGNGLMNHYLKHQLGYQVTSVDIDPELGPDIVGSVLDLERLVHGRTYDVVCAFQVLEHLPFADFPTCLAQLTKASRRGVVISLPHWGYFLQFRARVLKFRWAVAWGKKITRPFEWKFDGQHYWELGTKGHSLGRVRSLVGQHLHVESEYFCPDYPYHYYYECRVQS